MTYGVKMRGDMQIRECVMENLVIMIIIDIAFVLCLENSITIRVQGQK